MTMFGGGGYGFEAGDPNLHDKIAKLKAKRGAQSGKQRVEEFLEKELHVDPRDLPLALQAAKDRLKEIMQSNACDLIIITGNSLGLKAVEFKDSGYSDPMNGCPNCGTKTAGGNWSATRPDKGDGDWYCYDCDETSVAPLPPNTLKTADENKHDGQDWHDLKRVWTSFVANARVTERDGEPLNEPIVVHSFSVTSNWNGVEVAPIVPPMPEADPAKYPSGATLRIQKASFDTGDLEVETRYVRVGGLFNDTDIVNLDNMQPIQDLTGWTVIEEL